MKIRRGCGCPVLILFVVNAIMVIASLLSLVRGSSGVKVWGVVLYLLVFLGNAGVCLLVALAALRGGTQTLEPEHEDAATESQDEGEDNE